MLWKDRNCDEERRDGGRGSVSIGREERWCLVIPFILDVETLGLSGAKALPPQPFPAKVNDQSGYPKIQCLERPMSDTMWGKRLKCLSMRVLVFKLLTVDLLPWSLTNH